jgi:hypothetical protein
MVRRMWGCEGRAYVKEYIIFLRTFIPPTPSMAGIAVWGIDKPGSILAAKHQCSGLFDLSYRNLTGKR